MSAFANLPEILQPRDDDIQQMLSAGVHTGTRNSSDEMSDYVWRRRNVSLRTALGAVVIGSLPHTNCLRFH